MMKEDVLALTVADLDLPTQTANWVVERVRKDTSSKERKKLWKEVTIGEVIAAYPPYEWTSSNRHRRSIVVDRFYKALVDRGLTRFDWLYLPQSTLTMKVMKSLPLTDWLDRPAFLLGTLSGTALRIIAWRDGVDQFTVRKLLCYFDERSYDGDRLIRYSTASFVATRTLLTKLGFRYEDGSFMQVETRRKLAEWLAKEFKLGARQAAKTVAVAEAVRWVSFPD